jgi:hypothetical protein
LSKATESVRRLTYRIAHMGCADLAHRKSHSPTRAGHPDRQADRAGGDTKTPRSRRTLKLPQIALGVLRERKAAQAANRLSKAGEPWQDSGLVFTTAIGTMLDQHNIRA